MTSCGHSFCLQCITPLAASEALGLNDWNCPLCQTPQIVNPQETSRNYALEQILESLSDNTRQEKIDRAKHKLNTIVESMITELTDQQVKINELIEKEPDQFKGNIIRRDFLFQLTLCKFFGIITSFSYLFSSNMDKCWDSLEYGGYPFLSGFGCKWG